MFVGILATTLEIVQHEQSTTQKIAICKECNRRKIQNENMGTWKSATWNRAIHKKSATQKKVQHEKIATQIMTIKCSMKKVHYSAQTDNRPSVHGPLYTGVTD